MTTTSTSPEKKKEDTESSLVPMLAAVIGSVAGTFVTIAFNTSPEIALVGAALGAAIPPLVAVVGPFTHLRLGAGVLIAGIALLVTYGGFTITETAADKPTTTFPVPEQVVQRRSPSPPTSPSPSASPSPTPSTYAATCEEDLCINWAPRRLYCANDSCESSVTVWSEGSEQLRVTSLEFTGDAADRLSQEGTCDDDDGGKTLDQGEPCVITIEVESGEPGTARLIIHQNLQGPPSLVDIEVGELTNPSSSPGTLDLRPTGSTCLVVPQENSNILRIFPTVQHEGPLELSRPVPIRVSSDTGLVGEAEISVKSGGPSAVPVDLRADDLGKPHSITITIDPNNEIPEREERNNTLDVSLTLPLTLDEPLDVPC